MAHVDGIHSGSIHPAASYKHLAARQVPCTRQWTQPLSTKAGQPEEPPNKRFLRVARLRDRWKVLESSGSFPNRLETIILGFGLCILPDDSGRFDCVRFLPLVPRQKVEGIVYLFLG